MTTPVLAHEHYELGNEIVLNALFTNRAGEPAVLTTVHCKVRKPDGTIQVLATEQVEDNEDENEWEAIFTPYQVGKHWYTFYSDTGVRARSERAFQVLEEHVTGALDQDSDAPDAAFAWQPLTTVVDGEPQLVWDENDELIMTYAVVNDEEES